MRAIKRQILGLAATATLLAGMGVAQAKIVRLHAMLHPAAGVTSNGHGTMHGKYNTTTHQVSWNVVYHHLTSKVIMAHFHGPISAPGQNAAIQIWLTKKPPHPMAVAHIRGHARLTADQAKELLAGDWYVMIHTKKYPGGELRGIVHEGAGG